MRALLKSKENDVYNIVCEVVNDALTAGGGTRDIDTGKKAMHKAGYYVGVSNIYTGKVSKLNFWEAAYKTVHCGEPFIGSWLDEDGEMYVDATRWVEERKTAIQIAKTYHQKVIWDIANNTEIRVNNRVCTDPDCNQYREDLSKKIFLFSEDRTVNPVTGGTKKFVAEINLDDYDLDEIVNYCIPFGFHRDEVIEMMKQEQNFALVAECIFELLTED